MGLSMAAVLPPPLEIKLGRRKLDLRVKVERERLASQSIASERRRRPEA